MRLLIAAVAWVCLAFPAWAQNTRPVDMTANPGILGTDAIWCQRSTPADYKCTPTTLSSFVFGLVSGDVTINGSGVATLANSGVSGTTCGDATHSCGLTYNSKGLLTAVTNNVISGAGAVTGIFHGAFRSGLYYELVWFNPSATSVAGNADAIYFSPPIYIDQSVTTTNLGAFVIGGGTGSSAKLALYADSGGFPSGAPACVDNAGTATTSATTAIQPTAACTFGPGLFWPAVKQNGSVRPTFTGAVPTNGTVGGFLIGQAAPAGNGAHTTGLTCLDTYTNNFTSISAGVCSANSSTLTAITTQVPIIVSIKIQ